MGENNQDPDTLPEADRTVTLTAMGYDCAFFTLRAADAEAVESLAVARPRETRDSPGAGLRGRGSNSD